MSDQIVEPPNLHRQISTDTTHDYPVWNNPDDPFDFDMMPGTPGFHPNRDRRQLVAEIDRLVQENNRLIEENNLLIQQKENLEKSADVLMEALQDCEKKIKSERRKGGKKTKNKRKKKRKTRRK